MPIDLKNVVWDDEIESTSTINLDNVVWDGEAVGTTSKKKSIGAFDRLTGKIMTGGDAAISPGMLSGAGHWVAGGLMQTLNDLATIPAHYVNQVLLNLPRSLENTFGRGEYPVEAQSGVAQGLNRLAGITGAIGSAPAKALTALSTKIMSQPARLANLAKLAGVGALSGAAYSPTENFKDIEQRKQAAIVGAVVPVAGKVVTNILSKAPDRNIVAGRIINSIIKPLKKDFSYGKNPGIAIAKEKLTANNLDELSQKISERREEVGKQIGSAVKKSKDMVNLRGILRPLDETLARIRRTPSTNAALISRLEGLRDDLRKVIGGKEIQLATPSIAFEMKKTVGSLTKWTGNPSDDEVVNKSLKMIYGRLRNRLEEAVPETASLNERYANLTSAEGAVKYRDVILQRQELVGFGTTNIGMGSALIAAIFTGGQTIPSILTGLTVGGITQLMKSPAFQTRLASAIAQTTKAQRNNLFQKIPALKEVVLNGVFQVPSRIIDEISME